jgi:hypothetical protein
MFNREAVLFIEKYFAVPFVGYLISRNILPVDGKDIWTHIIGELLTGIIMLVLYKLIHLKEKRLAGTPEDPSAITVKSVGTWLLTKLRKPQYTASASTANTVLDEQPTQ